MTGTLPMFHVEQSVTTSDDYYTPRWVFDALGLTFDLDVAAPPGGVPWVPARRYYTMADDGLAQPWVGRVWMNPPFSGPAPWARRFIEHSHGVALVPFAKARWAIDLWDAADGIVSVKELSDFSRGSIFIACALVAFGAECVAALASLGRVR